MNLCSHTPTLDVTDPRGLPVRRVGFYRANAQSNLEPRITRQAFDLAGRRFASSDPRLDQPATSTVFSLFGQPLLTDNVDAGWHLTLLGEAGQALESHDSRGTLSTVEYDELMRPVAMAETLDGEPARASDRFMYGDASAQWIAHNQCGRLLRRDDSAGSVWFSEYGLTGAVLHQERGFRAQTGRVDWPQQPSQRDLLLEAQRYLSTNVVSTGGEVIEQTDARGNRRSMAYARSGKLKSTAFQSSGSDKVHVLVSDIHYHAMGAVQREVAGNGVISTATYDSADKRLTRLLTLNCEGQVLQDLCYLYDPVGNVVSVEDRTQPVSYFRNQRVEPVSRYVYDSLYQLIEATGREVAPTSHLPGLPDLQNLPMDPQRLINYTQRYEYDAGGNLLARHHSGAETWRMGVSSTSNRSLPQRADGTLPDEGQIAEAFDGNGNLKALQPGQAMTWDGRNQLSEVTAVEREDRPDDCELYWYDGDGQRLRKLRSSQVRSRTLTAQVLYLPGLEIHRHEATGEVRHVLTVEAGRNSVRVLHWESGKPDGIENDQLRYSLTDHLGSSTLELDQDANLISHEGYYPFGGTAWWAARSAVEAKYKTVRYSSKERDATGLYYYGFRYYAPWLQRWINPDPVGALQDMNLYQFVGRSPVSRFERDGHQYEGVNDEYEKIMERNGAIIVLRGLALAPLEVQEYIHSSFIRVEEIYRTAVSMYQEDASQTERIMQSFFGPAHFEVTGAVVDAWTRSADLALEFQSGVGGAKIVGTLSPPAFAASVIDGDPHGRIFLNLLNDDSSRIDTTLGHEITHLSEVSGFSAVGPRSNDYFYLGGTHRSLISSADATRDVIGEQGYADALMNEGFSGTAFQGHQGLDLNFVNRVKNEDPMGEVTDISSATGAFDANHSMAARLASTNADSILFSAVALHRSQQWATRKYEAHGYHSHSSRTRRQ